MTLLQMFFLSIFLQMFFLSIFLQYFINISSELITTHSIIIDRQTLIHDIIRSENLTSVDDQYIDGRLASLAASRAESYRRCVRWSVKQCEITPEDDLTSVTAPAHLYATDAVVYTALFFFSISHLSIQRLLIMSEQHA